MKPDNHILFKQKIGVLMVNLGTPEKTDYISIVVLERISQ